MVALLALTALVSWQMAERRDTDTVSFVPIAYERTLATPMWSARRIPRTLQAPVVDDAIRPTLDALISGSPATSCLLVRSGDRIIQPASNVTMPLVPASNQKLFTTFAAFQLLGPEFRFRTTVLADSAPVDGVVVGNLYLVGDGDPFLTTDDWWAQYEHLDGRHHTRLESLVERIVAAGVTEVTGSLIGDESAFDAVRQGPWADRLIVSKQSGPLSALTVNEGFVAWPSDPTGSSRQRSETDNPPLQAASTLAQLLAAAGITIGGVEAGVAPVARVEIAAIESPNLVDLVTHINSYSSNIGAELLLKKLGQVQQGEGSTPAGAATVFDLLTVAGIPTAGLVINDGSGLAETDRITCAAMSAILTATGPESDFARTLSVGGERGSLAARFAGTPGAGAVLAKTGTLNDATALSGFIASANDADVALSFAYVANESFIIGEEEVLGLQDVFAVGLTAYPGRPTLDTLSPRPPTVS